jgi:hypothetical protein
MGVQMTDNKKQIAQFGEIDIFHQTVAPILAYEVDQLFVEAPQMVFQSITHQIWNMVQEYVAIRTVLEARMRAPKDQKGNPTLHMATLNLIDKGYLSMTVLGFRKLTEPMNSDRNKAVNSLPTVLEHLARLLPQLDDSGQRYLGLRNFVKEIEKKPMKEITALQYAKPPESHHVEGESNIQPEPAYSYTAIPKDKYAPLLAPLLCVVQHINEKYRHGANKIFAHAAQKHTWESTNRPYGIVTLDEVEADLRALVIVHNLLMQLLLGRDCSYTDVQMMYGLEKSFGLSLEQVKEVGDFQKMLTKSIDAWRKTASEILRKPELAQSFLEEVIERSAFFEAQLTKNGNTESD